MNTHKKLSTALIMAGLFAGAGFNELSAQNWLTAGNVVAAGQFLGSTNSADVVFRTNNTDRMRILSTGSIGIGLAAPASQLDVANTFRITSTGFAGRSLRLESGQLQRITSVNDFFITSETGTIIFQPGLVSGVRNFTIRPGGGADLFFADGTLNFVGIGTATPTAKFQVVGGQISQRQAGAFGSFANGNEWIGLGIAGTQATPITSVYGLAMSRGASASYFNLVNSTAFVGTEDLIVGFGGEGAALDANQRMRVRSIRTNGVNAPVNKDLMVFNAAGYVGVNADPANIAFLVDATTTAIPATNSFRAITVLSNGTFAAPAAATFSSIGQEGNSTITPGTDITGLRAQNGNSGLNCQVNGNAAEITWQDLQFGSPVSSATNTQDRLTFNFRNNINVNSSANKREVMTILANGRVGINTATPVDFGTTNVLPNSGANINFFLDVFGGARAEGFWAFSDQRFKTNVQTLENPMARILKMRGTSYIFNGPSTPEGSAGSAQIGFIAQELQEVVPEAVALGADGVYAVNYNAITPLLVEGIKAQQQEIDAQKQQNLEQQAQITTLLAEVATLKGQGATTPTGTFQDGLPVNPELGNLQQNVPNPFNQQTVINFNVAQNAGVAMITIYDLNGRQIRSEQLNQRGNGQLVINANELSPGMYIYALIVDGKAADSKRMIVTE